jgi:hypothetical protein
VADIVHPLPAEPGKDATHDERDHFQTQLDAAWVHGEHRTLLRSVLVA